MSGAHTPGPWLYRPQEFDDWGTVRAAPDEQGRMWPICQARNPAVRHDDYGRFRESGTDPFEANARLIAAAPELLVAAHDAEWALEGMVEGEDLGEECPRLEGFELCGAQCCEHSGCAVDRLARIRAAIAKATPNPNPLKTPPKTEGPTQ